VDVDDRRARLAGVLTRQVDVEPAAAAVTDAVDPPHVAAAPGQEGQRDVRARVAHGRLVWVELGDDTPRARRRCAGAEDERDRDGVGDDHQREPGDPDPVVQPSRARRATNGQDRAAEHEERRAISVSPTPAIQLMPISPALRMAARVGQPEDGGDAEDEERRPRPSRPGMLHDDRAPHPRDHLPLVERAHLEGVAAAADIPRRVSVPAAARQGARSPAFVTTLRPRFSTATTGVTSRSVPVSRTRTCRPLRRLTTAIRSGTVRPVEPTSFGGQAAAPAASRRRRGG